MVYCPYSYLSAPVPSQHTIDRDDTVSFNLHVGYVWPVQADPKYVNLIVVL